MLRTSPTSNILKWSYGCSPLRGPQYRYCNDGTCGIIPGNRETLAKDFRQRHCLYDKRVWFILFKGIFKTKKHQIYELLMPFLNTIIK